jgi:CelD/BcsL family acetyltransferase involved in cellulose biosynthesis
MLLTQPTGTALYRTLAEGEPPTAAPAEAATAAGVTLTIYDDLAATADAWRTFETTADGTAFQRFVWHATWQDTIGVRQGVRPAIVVGRRERQILFIIPLAVEPGFVRRLVWHASDLCDYNAPLLATDFASEIDSAGFAGLFAEIRRAIAARPGLAFDAVSLTKMPETVGNQPNPFMALATTLNPSGACATSLAGTWDAFYAEKRSSATRRRDRTKRKRLAGFGEIRFVTAETREDITATLATHMAQKSQAFARMGVPDLFERPGYRDFFQTVAADPAARGLVHVSRLDVGEIAAAVNLGLVAGGVYYHVLASYDAGETSRFGPGAAHLHELMAHAIRLGCRTFDFTIGDERYKREWSDRTLRLHDHRSAVTAKGWLATLPSEAWARIKRLIKQTPFLWQAASKLRAMAGTLKTGRAGRGSPGSGDDS